MCYIFESSVKTLKLFIIKNHKIYIMKYYLAITVSMSIKTLTFA